MTTIRVEHTKMAMTAAVLAENAAGLKKSVARMNATIDPLKANFFQSGSLTGAKVQRSQTAVDEAVKVITSQLGGTSQVVDEYSKKLSKWDNIFGGD